MPVLQDVITYFNQWIPSDIAWEKDNTGLQIGNPGQEISGILLAVDLTEEVLNQALENRFNLIITHHPFFFHSIKSINYNSTSGQLVYKAIQNNISIYTAHTNLDFVVGGVSTVLAESLGLTQISLLKPHESYNRKLSVFVPETHSEKVHHALSEAGAGQIGNYDSCSFQVKGKGTFKGNELSNPVVGKPLQLETVEEIKLEMIYPRWKESAILKALRASHPYEEIAYDIIPLLNKMTDFGFGSKGFLPQKMKLKDWLEIVKTTLKAENIRYSGDLDQEVLQVAVCGGSGSELSGLAKSSGADCFVTSDLKYHTFFEADPTFSLVDAGHYETENITLNKLKSQLQMEFSSLKIELTTIITNPVHFY